MEVIERQARGEKFVALMMEGGEPHASAKKAGYTNPQRDAYKIILEKRAQDFARRVVKAKCIIQGMPMAYDYLYRTMLDPRKDDRIRVVCAKEIMAAGGLVAPKAGKSEDDVPTDPMKMSRAQLVQSIENAKFMLAEHAKFIEHAPQAIDSYL